MKYCDAVAYLDTLPVLKKPGEQGGDPELLKRLGDPQKDLKMITVQQ